MGTTRTLLTFEQFENLPDQPGKCELIRGELLELPPAEAGHYRKSAWMYEQLKTALNRAHDRDEAKELGEVCIEAGYQLSADSWLQPDVSVMHATQCEGKYFLGAPAIAIEVVSPSNTTAKLERKSKLYLECGALEVWHVYPKRQVVIITAAGTKILKEGDPLTTPLLPGFTIPLSELIQ